MPTDSEDSIFSGINSQIFAPRYTSKILKHSERSKG